MFRGNRWIVLATAATALGLFWLVPKDEEKKKDRPEEKVKRKLEKPERPKKANPAWGEDMAIVVNVGPMLEENVHGNQQLLDAAAQVAGRLNGMWQVPEARRQYFGDLAQQHYHMLGWSGYITHIQQEGGGHRVQLSVGPMLDDPGQPAPMVHSGYTETYFVSPDDIFYLGSEEVEHMRGWGYSIVTTHPRR